MILVPEARTAIFRTAVVTALAAACIFGAIRTDRRWARILLGVLAVPATIYVLLGALITSLIVQYGPR